MLEFGQHAEIKTPNLAKSTMGSLMTANGQITILCLCL